jgi:hypothetical protein
MLNPTGSYHRIDSRIRQPTALLVITTAEAVGETHAADFQSLFDSRCSCIDCNIY